MTRFFSYSPWNGFEIHTTLEEAKGAAKAELDGCADDASSDGWPGDGEVESICYGELKGSVQVSKRMPWEEWLKEQGEAEEDIAEGGHPFDEYVDYEVRETEEKPGADLVAKLVAAMEALLSVNAALMPGLPHIACQDYQQINEAPINARGAILAAKEQANG